MYVCSYIDKYINHWAHKPTGMPFYVIVIMLYNKKDTFDKLPSAAYTNIFFILEHAFLLSLQNPASTCERNGKVGIRIWWELCRYPYTAYCCRRTVIIDTPAKLCLSVTACEFVPTNGKSKWHCYVVTDRSLAIMIPMARCW